MLAIHMTRQHTKGGVERVVCVADLEPQYMDTFESPIAFACAIHLMRQTVQHGITNVVRSTVEVDVKIRGV